MQTAPFETRRLLAAGKLTGDWSYGPWRIRPSVEYSYFTETQLAYTNAIDIDIGESTTTLNRLAFGPEVSRRFTFGDDVSFEPYAGIKGVLDFAEEGDTTAAGTPVAGGSLHARVELGASLRNSEGLTFRASGSYDGVGDNGFHSTEGKASLIVPLH